MISAFSSTSIQIPSFQTGRVQTSDNGVGNDASRINTAEISRSGQGNKSSIDNSKQTENNDQGQSSRDQVQLTKLTPEEQKTVTQLKERDIEVRAHEQAHAAVGGQYAGSPQYDYQTGPDGKRYAVGGSVSIDVSAESDPEATIQKMQIVRRAAMAPAEPSAQDYKVAAEATQKETQARAQVSQKNGVAADPSEDGEDSTSQSGKAADKDSTKSPKTQHHIHYYNTASSERPANQLSLFA